MATTALASSGRWLHWLGQQLTNTLQPARYLDPLLEPLDPMWVQGQTPARVLEITQDTDDSCTLTLQPAKRWGGFEPGQHVTLGLEIDGRRYSRTFSLACAPSLWTAEGRIRITIKQAKGGRVTPWIREHLHTGTVISISPAFGEFELPKQPVPLLYIAGGSGITPILSHLEHLAENHYAEPITLLYYVSHARDAIAWARIQTLAEHWPALTARLICTRDPDDGNPDRICAAHLAVWTPDLAGRRCYLCGPQGLMEAAESLLTSQGVEPQAISHTYFAVPQPLTDGQSGGEVNCTGSHQSFLAEPGQTLLEAAEAAGLAPKYGCRMGICHECSCRKTAGQVRNRLTGAISSPGEEPIQLCISEAQGPVDLAL